MAQDRRRQAALMIALGLAMKAKLDEADPAVLGHAVTTAKEVFHEGDPMRDAVASFSDGFAINRRNPEMLRRAGDDLMLAVVRAARPSPCQRADIWG